MSFRGQLIKAGIDSNGTDVEIFDGYLKLNTDNKLYFRDTGCYIYSNADGYLTIEADTGVVIAANFSFTGTLSIETNAVGIDFTGTYSTAGIRLGTHDWGVGSTGITVPATSPLLQVAGKVASTVTAAGVYACEYEQLAITKTQDTGSSFFASWNELYITGGTIVLTSSDHYAGIWGHLEISGTVTTGTGFYSGGHFSVITPSTFTIASGARLAGCHVDMKLASGYSNSGIVAAFYAEKGAEEFATIPYGLYLEEDSFTTGIYSGAQVKIGTHDWGVGSTGLEIAATDPLFQVAGKVTSTTTAGVYSAAYLQTAITAAQSAGSSFFGLWSELYVTGDIDLTGSDHYAGVWGHVEISGTVDSSTGFVAGIHGSVIIPSTYTNDGIVAGIHVDEKIANGTTNNGVYAGLAVERAGTEFDKFDCVVYAGSLSADCFAQFVDDSIMADANGSLGATAGFIRVKIGDTFFKLQTYAEA